jgi:hypothetical protein
LEFIFELSQLKTELTWFGSGLGDTMNTNSSLNPAKNEQKDSRLFSWTVNNCKVGGLHYRFSHIGSWSFSKGSFKNGICLADAGDRFESF